LEVFTVRNDKDLQQIYKNECNIERIGEQIVESSSGKNVIRAPLKMKKNGKLGFRVFN
jgi:hypothetical protein